mgnify:CR=1 FL=1
MMQEFRVGHGQDAHRLVAGRRLVIGGVPVESQRGADAHSDGDVLLHALADALLSAYALGDIGRLFPPSDARFAGMDSRDIVAQVLEKLRVHTPGVRVVNVAAVVTLDTPKLGAARDAMSTVIAELLELQADSVGITFKTSEGLAPDHVQASVVLGLLQAELT